MRSMPLMTSSSPVSVSHIIFALLISLAFLLPVQVANAVEVTSVSGTVSDGTSIAIFGLDFGNYGPNVVVFDDFESGVANSKINTGPGSAKYGKWDNISSYGSEFYGTTASVSGNQSFTSDYSVSYVNWIETLLPASNRNVFVSWWLYLPANNNLPGEGNAAGINWKQLWIQGADTTDDDLVVPTLLGTSSSSWYINGNETDPGYRNYTTVDFHKGEWKRLWVWLKGSTTSTSGDGELKFWELTNSGVVQRENDIGVNTLKQSGVWERVRPNGYGRQTSNCFTSFDDIYIAAGPYAQARVEMGNAATYNTSTKLTILTPTAWADRSISATVNVGNFNSGERAYIYVFDRYGAVNSTGYEVFVGSAVPPGYGEDEEESPPDEGDDETPTKPEPPTELRIQSQN
jgi:hypothetical protein